MHNHPPLGEEGSGFTRPEKVKEDVETVDVRTLDEDIHLLAAEDVAEEADGGYAVDARDVVEDGHEADVVKVLGSGQVRNELQVTADAFSETASEKIEDAGGAVTVSERAQSDDTDEHEQED
jgi:large subunit ribosomal protein L15